MKKSIAIVLAILMIAGAAAVAGTSFADSHTTSITAFLNRGISMTWDGGAFEPRESDGSRLYPIVYNGRTYLPAKFVADKAGVDVDWDASTQTVIFNSRAVKIDLTEPYRDSSSSGSGTGITQAAIERLPFTKFDLDIDGDDDDDDLDVEFEIRSNGSVYAKVEIEIDDRKEVELTGQAAIDYLLPIFQKLDINASMSQSQIIDRVMKAFNWARGYEEFELEVRFKDGIRIDIEIDD